MSADTIYDVIVVGAGISGLACADSLVLNGVTNCLILEGSNRVGGRTQTGLSQEGYLDFGGEFVCKSQHYVMGMIDRFGIPTFDTWLPADKLSVYEASDGGKTYFAGGNYPLTEEVWRSIVGLELGVDSVRCHIERPWEAFDAVRLDSVTVKQWADAALTTPYAKELMTVAIRSAFSVEPDALSFLYLLYYAATCGTFQSFENVRGGGDSIRLTYGTKSLFDALLREIMQAGVQVTFGKKVVEIDRGAKEDDLVSVKTEAGEVYKAQRVIVAMSPIANSKITFTPQLSAARRGLIDGAPMARTIKGFLLYNRPWWRGQFTGYVLSAKGPADWVMDNSWKDPSDGIWKYPSLMAFVVGDKAGELSQMAKGDREVLLRAHVESLFEPLPPDVRFIGYREMDWIADPWSFGCPAGCLAPTVLTRFGTALRQPDGKVHWAGSESGTEWAGGYMNGAIQGGIRAAGEVLQALGRRSPLVP